MEARASESPRDSDLVEAARAGEAAAWEALVQTYQEPIFRLAYLILGDPAEAEDTAQDTFVRAYRALDRFDRERPLRPWLLTIAANLARNRRRSLGRALAFLPRLFRSAPPALDTIEDRSIQRGQQQRLWAAIRQLDLNDQQVIYLRYFLEMPAGEVAETLQIAEGTVKSRTHRALNRLRAVIGRDYPDLREAGFE